MLPAYGAYAILIEHKRQIEPQAPSGSAQSIEHNGEERMRSTTHKICLVALSLITSAGIASAAEVRLISVGGVKGALDPIIAEFSKASGHTVKYNVGYPLVVLHKLDDEHNIDGSVQSGPG